MSTLFLTYDGLTTMIAQSQVIPYLTGIAKAGFGLRVVSFERQGETADARLRVEHKFRDLPVEWLKRPFRTSPPFVAKYLDQTDMVHTARKNALDHRITAIHSRSYIGGYAGMLAKERTEKPHIFDMRGFWVDSRLEGGRWTQSNPFYRRLYQTWKQREARMIATADAIVVLTDAARTAVESWPSYKGAEIVVIPCTVSFERFRQRTPELRKLARAELGIAADAKVLCYLGSLGTIYRLPEMLRYFGAFKNRYPGARMLFIGSHHKQEILRIANASGVAISPDEIIVTSAPNDEVPKLLAAADLGLCFYTPTFSSVGVSPTKLGEYLASGLPVIANTGVGDVAEIIATSGSGHALRTFDRDAIADSVQRTEQLLTIPPEAVRARARERHDLPLALKRYTELYRGIQRRADRTSAAA